LKMKPGEGLFDFYFRTEAAIQTLRTLKANIPSDEKQAINFIQALSEDPPFAVLRDELEKRSTMDQKNRYPPSLGDAYQLADTFLSQHKARNEAGLPHASAISSAYATVRNASPAYTHRPDEAGKQAKSQQEGVEVKSPCYSCDGALNKFTGGKHHKSYKCPLTKLKKLNDADRGEVLRIISSINSSTEGAQQNGAKASPREMSGMTIDPKEAWSFMF